MWSVSLKTIIYNDFNDLSGLASFPINAVKRAASVKDLLTIMNRKSK